MSTLWGQSVWGQGLWQAAENPVPGVGSSMRKLLTGFEKYTIVAMVRRATSIKDGLTEASWCNDPWPAPFPSKANVIASISDFLTKASAAEDGGKDRIAARDAARVVMEGFLTSAAPYLQALAAGDVEKLEQTGYELSKERGPASSELPGQPQNVRLKHGDVGGSFNMSCKADKLAMSYEAQLGTDPNSEASFTIQVISGGCRKIVIPGVTPGTVYYGRLRAIGRNGMGPWSDVAQLRAL